MPERYKFSDVNETTDMGKENGCYVRVATGFVLAFLAIAIAIGVGIIVHLAENRKLECVYPDGNGMVGSSQIGSQQGQCPNASCPACNPTSVRKTTMAPNMTPQPQPQPKPDVRLPRDFIPTEYVLRIQPDMYGEDPKAFTFAGNVRITMLCASAANKVVLHAKKINVTSVTFTQVSGSGVPPKYVSHEEDKGREFLIIHLDRMASPEHTYTLSIAYTGPLRDDLQGFYLSTYQQNGQTVYTGVTQFEPTDARKAFPCFDEPAMKASFQLTLVRKKHQMSLSNMPVTNRRNIDHDFVEDIYETSVKMSTYLVAFVIGEFENTTRLTANNVTYGAWSRPQFQGQVTLALDVGTKILTFYESYFGIRFPLPKQDMIALPDFRAGAMENWGLITYREAAMLYDEHQSSVFGEQRVTVTITHEVAHQWFGNLVTMEWWDDIWLNEGFARFIEYMGADHLYPEWKMMDQFVVNEIHAVFELDALKTSHPIYFPVNSPDEIHQVFDGISYSKGGSVIRMIRFVLGEDTFKKGLHNYLDTLKYKNAFHDDLWDAWSKQALADHKTINVTEIMNRWILQMNYPVVTVRRNAGSITVNQKRFLKNEDSVEPDIPSPYGYTWHIPFTFTTSITANFNISNSDIHWLRDDNTAIPLVGETRADWIIGNINQEGYYRVNYEDSNWEALIKQLKTKHTVISTVNRAQIINDAWSLSRAGYLSTEIALKTLEYLNKETEYVPWVAAISQITYVDNMLAKSSVYGSFKDFVKFIVSDPFKSYGLDDPGSSHIDSLTRSVLAEMACAYGVETCTVAANSLYQQWMEDPDNNPISADLKSTVYCTAIASGGIKEWEFLLNQFQQTSLTSDIDLILDALACTKSPWILSRYLEITLENTVIRKQDVTHAISAISSNPIGGPLAWDFVRENWDFLFNEFGNGLLSFTRLISGVTKTFNTDLQLQQLEEFGRLHSDLGSGSRAFTQAIEKTQSNAKWLKENKQVVSDWLSSKGGVTKTSRVTDVRLPRHLKPISYELTLKPNMYGPDAKMFTFDGHVKITMIAEETGSNVTLHVNKLNISDVSIRFGRTDNQQSPVYKDRSSDKQRQFEIFFLTGSLDKGVEYYIEMNFTGPLTGDLAGLYLSQYKRGNKTIYLATTQFEATDARKAFPCFDEPALKATFKVTLIRKSNIKTVSNTPIIGNTTLADGFVADKYMETLKMSTYLLAFVFCDFDYKEGKTKRNVTYRAWARPESINQTDIALKTGVDIITFYEDYFNIPFPLPKQGMIAVPDFSAGAMENWGLITYRETAMLYEPGVSSERNLQRVKVVIAHELAHQWFGDLVTMDWWDDLWLNEGFASFVEYMGVDKVSPDWKMFEQFVFELYDVFEIDAKVTSHPIYVPVYNPEEINEIFDTISYGKGACVIRMIRFFLGEETFQKGLQIYLSKRKFKNADHNDLWSALQEQAMKEGKRTNVKAVLDTWILQMNFPVVTITKNTSGEIYVKQDRFLTNKDVKDPGIYNSTYNYVWSIPITFTTQDSINFNQTDADIKWMHDKSLVIPDSSNGWIIGNVQQYGLYRVNYDAQNWQRLIDQLKTNYSAIHAINRGQIINDAFGLAKAKLLPMETALKTLDYLDKEDEYVPWVAAGSELSYINTMISDTVIYGTFQSLMVGKVTPLFSKLTMNNTGADHLESYLRSSIVSKACAYGNENCVGQSRSLFDEYMKNPSHNPIDPELKSTVYCTAIKQGGQKEWDFVYKLYLGATVQAEKARLLSTLSCTRKIWLLNKLLNLAMNDSIVRKQDAGNVFSNVGQNPVGKYVAWDFFRTNWDALFKTYGVGSFSLGTIISGITSSFNTETQLQQLKDFQKSHPDMGSGTRAFAQAIEGTQSNIRWMTDFYGVLELWLVGQH